MGNHNVGETFEVAAEVFWLMVPDGTTPDKALVLKALEIVGEPYRGADAEFDDALVDHTTPLGRMVAIAFDATEEEMGDPEDDESAEIWFDGPYARFREHFEFC